MFPLSLLLVSTYVFIEDLMAKKPRLSLIKGRPIKRMLNTRQKENGRIRLGLGTRDLQMIFFFFFLCFYFIYIFLIFKN